MAAEYTEQEEPSFSYLRPPIIPEAKQDTFRSRLGFIKLLLSVERPGGDCQHVDTIKETFRSAFPANPLNDEKVSRYTDLAIEHYVARNCMTEEGWINVAGGTLNDATKPKKGFFAKFLQSGDYVQGMECGEIARAICLTTAKECIAEICDLISTSSAKPKPRTQNSSPDQRDGGAMQR